MRVVAVDLSARFEGLTFEAVPVDAARSPKQELLWEVRVMVRNACRYFGVTTRFFYRWIFCEYGEHVLHVYDGSDSAPMPIVEFERRLSEVCERFRVDESPVDVYRGEVDRVAEHYDLALWRVWICVDGDLPRRNEPNGEAGEAVVLVERGSFV